MGPSHDEGDDQYNYIPTTTMEDEEYLGDRISPNNAMEEFVDESVDLEDMDEKLPLSGKSGDHSGKRA